MGRVIAKKIRGMNWWAKGGLILVVTLMLSVFMQRGWFSPLVSDSATNTYHFSVDTTAVNVGADGLTSTTALTTVAPPANNRYSLTVGGYSTGTGYSLAAAATTTTMAQLYTPVYQTDTVLSAPVMNLAIRNSATGTSNWTVTVYDYDPSGSAGNGTVLYTGTATATTTTTTSRPVTFTQVAGTPVTVTHGHRVKVVVQATPPSGVTARLYYYSSSTVNSYVTFSESYPTNTTAVVNITDYNNGNVSAIAQGQQNVPMLSFQMATASGTTTWSGGALDLTGTAALSDVTFTIYKDTDGNGVFNPAADTKISDAVPFTQTAKQPYTLAVTQTLTTTPQRYFVVFNVSPTATAGATAGVSIGDYTYFTVGNSVDPMMAGAASAISIVASNTAVTKSYAVDFDSGSALTSPLSGNTSTACQASNSTITSGIGLLNYPNHSCSAPATTNYLQASATTSAFLTMYFNGASYPTATTVSAKSFVFYGASNSGSTAQTVTLTLFYVDASGAKVMAVNPATVNIPAGTTMAKYTPTFSGQTFTADVPKGARLGLQVGATAGTRLQISSKAGSNLVVTEIAVSNNGVDVSDGKVIPDGSVAAGTTGNVVDAFSMTAPTTRTLTGLTVTGGSNTNATNVGKVWIYRKVGTNLGALEGSDLAIGSGTISGTTANVSFTTSETVGGTVQNYLVVYDLASAAVVGQKLTGTVTAVAGDISDVIADSSAANLTIIASTIVKDAATEPASISIPAAAGATNVDGFGLYTNAASSDAINTITVQLASGTSGAIAAVDIVDLTNSKSYTSTAPISGDTWRITTSGLYATQGTTQCMVRITPKADAAGTFYTNAKVTALTHAQSTNALFLNDTLSAAITIDAYAPADTSLSAASGSVRDTVDLAWNAVTDSNLNAPAVSFKLVRGAANNPPPADCSGTPVYQGNALKFTDTAVGGNSYGYRICSVDSVGNTSAGAIASATAKLPQTCNQTPSISFVSSSNQYAKTGGTVDYVVNILNNDIGACQPVSYQLSLNGTANQGNFEAPVFPAAVTIPAGGGQNVHITIKTLESAAQGESESFTLRLAAASQATQVAGPGYAASAGPIVTSVNNFGPMLHSSFSVGAKYGTWGTKSTCNDCHINTWEATRNIKMIREVVTTPNGDRAVVFRQVSSSTATSGVFGNDARPATDGSSNICEVCHHQTKFHEYTSVNGRTKLGHHNGEDCMKCHPHKGGFKYVGGAIDCVSCHGNPPTTKLDMAAPPTNALGSNPSDWGAHATHNNIKITCVACHNNYSTDQMGNTALEMGFAIRSTTYSGFKGTVGSGIIRVSSNINTFYHWTSHSPGTVMVYTGDQTPPSCSVYCHGGWNGSGASNPTPGWVGQNQAACGTCHSVSNTSPPTTGSHQKHVASGNFVENGATVGGLNLACTKCHGAFANFTGSRHVNGSVEWDLSAISASATYRGANAGGTGSLAPSAAFGTCDNLYCHSTVQGANGLGAGTYKQPVWGGTAACGSCHVDMYTDGAATGGHKQHAQPSAGFATPFDCRICHGSGGTTNPLNHANGTINMDFSGYGANTVYSLGNSVAPGSAYGNCSNANCHGRRTVTWGPSSTLTLCEKCHGSQSSAGGFYATSGPGTAAGNTDPIVGAHNAHIHQVNSAFTLYTSYSMAKDCSECHIKPAGPYDAGHIDTPLPAEVTFQPGRIANKGIDTNVPGAVAPSYDPIARTCNNVWCHGSGMDSNTGNGIYSNVVADGGTLGTPRVPTWNQPFLNGDPRNDCTSCHSYPPPGPNENYTHFSHYSSNGAAVLKQSNECYGCHINVKMDGSGFVNSAQHINGVVDKGCNACHGVPPTTAGTLALTSNGALAPGQAGAHLAHASIPAIGKECFTCHNGYSTTVMPNGNMEIGFNAFNGQVTTGTFWGYSSMNNGQTVYASTSVGTTVRQTFTTVDQNTCSVYCHGTTLGGGSLAKPTWDSGAHQVCGNCHGVNVAYLNTTSLPAKGVPTTSSHVKHATPAGYNITCDVCHGQINNNAHVDGNITWNLALTDPRVGALATYNGQAKGGTGKMAQAATYGNCSNIYCHSSGQGPGGTGPITYANQQWGTAALACNACHADMNTSGTGSHTFHTQAAAGNYTCINCHGAGYTTTPGSITATTHVDRAVNVAGGVSYSKGTAFATGQAYGTCANNCHGRGTPTWGVSLGTAVQCDKCHAGPTYSGDFYSNAYPTRVTSTSDAHVGVHKGHLNATLGYAAKVTCASCHVVPTNVNDASHMNGTVEFNTTNILSYNPATGTCTSTCHGTMNGIQAGSNTTPTWTQANYLTGVPSLAECGTCHAFPPNSAAHASILPVTDFNTAIATCKNCHPHVNTNGTFNDPSLHMNGTIDAMSSGGADCSGCHTSLAAMTNDTNTFHHVLASTAVNYSGNTCLKCHADHNIFQVAQNAANTVGRSANLRVDNTAAAPQVGDAPGSSYTNTDFVAGATNGGLCVSCHNVAMTKNLSGQKYIDGFNNNTTMVVTKVQYVSTMHNYTTTSTFKSDSSTFVANCTKCHNDTMAETKQVGSKTFGLHLSTTRELFTGFQAAPVQDAREDRLCFGCHSKVGDYIDSGQTPKSVSGKDWYGSRTMRASAEDIFQSFTSATRVYRHNVGKYNGSHKATEGEQYLGANKHVECADCHNSHAAGYGNHAQGSSTLAAVLTGTSGINPTFTAAGAGTLGLPGVTGTTLYIDNSAVPASAPTAYKTTTTITTGTWTAMSMSNTAPSGTTPTTKTITLGATSNAYYGVDAFVSPVMTSGSTLSSQTATVTVYAGYATATTAPRLYAYAYLWNGTTATPLTTSTYATLATTVGAATFTVTVPQTSIVNGTTSLVVELYAQQRATTAGTVTIAYGATGTTGATAGPSKIVFTAAPVINWADATAYTQNTATAEYQICFKCHSNANKGWFRNMTSTAQVGKAKTWTNLALEFNPYNRSIHPVTMSLGAAGALGGPVTPYGLAAAAMNNGWTGGGTQVMTCTDCHATDSAASKGPHGSSVKWMLAGTNKAWPFTSAAYNGTDGTGATTFKLGTYNTNSGTTNGLFCLNCHPVIGGTTSGTNVNFMHYRAGVSGGTHYSGFASAANGACVSCHIRVPHGGKVSRLLRATGTAANLPARYYPNGAGGEVTGQSAALLKNITKPASWGGTVTFSSQACGTHTGSGSEQW